MLIYEATIKKWNDLHNMNNFRLRYPSEVVVQFVFHHFPRGKSLRLLDLGAGSGRHTFFLASEGYKVTASDVSDSAIDYINKMTLEGEFHNIETSVNSASHLPFESDSFDGCISYAVLYYLTYSQIELAFQELFRVLKKDGVAFIVVRSTDDHRFRKGNEIEKNTFIIHENDSNKSSFHENGMTMHFFSRDELTELTSSFSQVFIDRIDQTMNNCEFVESNFLVKLVK
ncbi:class I SAM-dependent methyltransferase [Paenibacillus andongensis]|uniref:class I SAM-dependent methyltransferase n=1 Tax=Paenibacillus andongensis TaxID=2975482 RepID=UPI0021BA5314|nr:class I SAM-dependent methyltransferase [Paenibacillus andongensis]